MTSWALSLLTETRRYRCIFAAIVLLILSPISGYAETKPSTGLISRPDLSRVKTWDYQLRRLDIEAAAARPSDMIVVEAGTGGDGTGVKDEKDVARLRLKPDGGQRMVIAYLSIGEAEDYRAYWQPAWRDTPPAWFIGENCRWPRNYLVRYWMPDWQSIMIGDVNSALTRILDAGFDGVYLDRVDVFQDAVELGLIKSGPARTAMIQFVRALSAKAKAYRPDFQVIVQNAEELLDNKAYRAAIDAVAKEDLLHGLKGTGVRNTSGDIDTTRDSLKRLQREGKPVFAIEYLTGAAQIDTVRAELARYRFTPVFPTRGLDGGNPVVTDGTALSVQHGTPEYGAATCDGLLTKKNSRP